MSFYIHREIWTMLYLDSAHYMRVAESVSHFFDIGDTGTSMNSV